MYSNVSQEFKEQLNNKGRNFRVRFLDMKGNKLDIIAVSLKLFSSCNEGAVLKLGGTVSSYFDAELVTDLTLYNLEVKLEIGTLVGEEYEWIPAGIYKFDKPEKNDTTLNVTAYDRMYYMMNVILTRNNKILGEHLSIKDMAGKRYPVFMWLRGLFEEYRLMGCTIDNTPDSYYEERGSIDPSNNVKGYMGNNDGTWSIYRTYMEGISAKELVANIATLFAGFAYFDRNGKLMIEAFGYGDNVTVSGKYEQTISEAPFSVDGIRMYGTYSVGYYDGEIVSVAEPDEEGMTEAKIIKNIGFVNGDSAYISASYIESGSGEKITGVSAGVGKEQLAKILKSFERIKGLEFYVGCISFFGNILLDPGDIINFVDKDGKEKQMLCTTITQMIDGGAETKVECVGLSENDSVDGASSANVIDYTEEQRYGLLWCQKLEAETVKTRELEAAVGSFGYIKTDELKAEIGKFHFITTDELEAQIGNFGYVKANELEAKVGTFGYIKTNELQAAVGKYGYITANEIDSRLASFGYVKTDELEAKIGTFGYLTAQQADIQYANIALSNVTTENVGLLLNKIGMIDRATIVDGHITGFLDAVEVNADRITTGTLIADRLLLRGSEQGLLYQLNNLGELVSSNVDTLDGTLLTERTVTADKLVAKSITANELDVANIFANTEVVNTLVGNEAFINKIMSNQVIVGASKDAADALTKATNALSTSGTASSTASSALAAANTASTNANSALNKADSAYISANLQQKTVDLSGSAYDSNKYYPVVATASIKIDEQYAIINVNVRLNSGTKPSWSTHANGFTCNLYVRMKASGWGGTSNKMGYIDDNSFSFCDKMPAYITQCTYNSKPILYLRGGGKYFVRTNYDTDWNSYTSKTNIFGSDYPWYVEPTTAPSNADFLCDISGWSYGNTTYINGGNIYTGTIDALAIKAGSVFTQELEAKNLKITGGSVKISTAASTEQNYIDFTRTYNSKTYKTEIGTGGICVSGDTSSASLYPGNFAVTVGGSRQLRFVSGVSGLEVRNVNNNNSRALMDYGLFLGYYNNTNYVQLAYDGTNFNYLRSKLNLGTSGSIANGDAYAVTGGTVYKYLNDGTADLMKKIRFFVNSTTSYSSFDRILICYRETSVTYEPGAGAITFCTYDSVKPSGATHFLGCLVRTSGYQDQVNIQVGAYGNNMVGVYYNKWPAQLNTKVILNFLWI